MPPSVPGNGPLYHAHHRERVLHPGYRNEYPPPRSSIWTAPVRPRCISRASASQAEPRRVLGLVPITTPAYSPQSNGLAEAFVKTFKRNYVDGAELRDAESVLAQLSGWIEDYNTRAPHSALGMRSPTNYRAAATLSSSR